jgi:peptidoglycan hydrolase-like protein with peptidoglycan-binding domain
MSTQYYTSDRPATSQPDTSHRAPRPGNQGPSWYRIWAIVIGAIIAVALIVVAATGLTHNHAATSSSPAASTSAPAGQASADPAQPSTPAAPAVVPSASVKKLQQQLGQLNYYEGSVDGIMGPQTIAAIKDLQRQANLPQTGTMNAATQAALANYLAHGNNQMAG